MVSGVSSSSYNRISGLASGLDTDTIVKQMVQAESTKLTKLQQDKTINSWKTDAYRDVNTKLADFRTAVEGLRLQSTFTKQTVSSSNPTAVGVSISGTPTYSDYSITSAQLAKPAQGASVTLGSNLTLTTQVDGAFTFNLTGATGTTKTQISVDATDTVQDVINKINAQSSSTGVKASFFDQNGSIVLNTVATPNSAATGSAANITIDDGTLDGTNGITSNNLGIVEGTTAESSSPQFANGTFSGGKDVVPGSVTINGVTMSINSNSFVFDGLKINLNTNIDSTNGPVSIQTANDTSGAFDAIKTFVDKYNTLIADLNSKISEQKDRDYPPLTDDQKKDMSDDDITLWTDKAKTGLLSNDSTISGMLQQLRTSLSEAVGGVSDTFNTLSDIGITTSTNYQDHGKLVLDETKLQSALDSNLDDVKNLFTKTYSSSTVKSSDTTVTSNEKNENSGLGWRIYDRINSTISQLATIAGSSSGNDTSSLMAKQLKTINDSLTKEQDRIDDYETNLYKKFSDMETALSKLNSQSSWLTQQLGTGY